MRSLSDAALLFVLVLCVGVSAVRQPAAAPATSAVSATMNPITRVVTLIEDMKKQVEKEGKEDDETYDKFACWCATNDRDKTAAIKTAEQRIEDLTADIEGYAALMSKLKTEIENLDEDIAEANKSLETAAAQREKEKAEFEAQEADLKEALSALQQAVAVLSKVQLMQKQGHVHDKEVGQMLLQVKTIVKHSLKHYKDVMQADLWDFLSSTGPSDAFMPKHAGSALDQQPIEGGGAAAGAKSYNSRSGQIYGILSEMMSQFGRDLASAQTEEATALIAFQKLRAAKQTEIDAASKLRDQKSAELAETTQADAQAKQDLEDTKAAMASDQEFLLNLKKNCKVADEEYAARQKVRGEELVALAEVLKILTNEDARDLFGKTVSLLQTSSVASSSANSQARLKVQNAARSKVVHRLLALAKRNHNWQLATLAVSAQLDAFTKVQEALDKMLAEMKQQQKDEYAKWEFCKKEIDANEDATKEKTHEKEDLEDRHQELSNTIETLQKAIEDLQAEVAEMQVSLKRAGEDRKAENQEFQAQVADQRAVAQILNKALARMKMFYEEKALVQVGVHGRQEPGAAVAPPPPKSKDYSKSAGAGGVLQLLQMCIEEAEGAEQELTLDEQKSQEAYASFVQETNSCLAACEKSITEKSEAKSGAESEKSETEAALLSVNQELTGLHDLNLGLHTDCDFLLENFQIRQTARKEEMDAIVEAKAILSGANFGL